MDILCTMLWAIFKFYDKILSQLQFTFCNGIFGCFKVTKTDTTPNPHFTWHSPEAQNATTKKDITKTVLIPDLTFPRLDIIQIWQNLDRILPSLSCYPYWKYCFSFSFVTTGWSEGTDKNYAPIARARKQPISWDRCPFLHKICTF